MKLKGKLTNWHDDKGFGFVEPNGGGDRAFVHIKAFQKRSRRPVDGDLIVYEQVKDAKGKFKAINVTLSIDRKLKKASPPKNRSFGSFVCILFCVFLLLMTVSNKLPIEVLYWYAGASVVAFLLYYFDKSAAQDGSWRTPEANLHLVSLLGGWPGAFYAQNALKHKSSKQEFKKAYWGTVVVNLGVFVWLLSAQGQNFITMIIG
ncbi:DUF1294 domain-containing protein [Glaciecola sp. XM2]|uniref:DUF1294 domain-containing protein n=1 Tax=Glaciecola sp. XM2 TaxID=1914931 RepID=UPI001BDEA53B|nr:cold shock and DUF1294 domain-containing protein [Glaciecola sp. XM2]MBT1449775.1 DUF1294 domain-containing protein [Glaciecola sp. XM2]